VSGERECRRSAGLCGFLSRFGSLLVGRFLFRAPRLSQARVDSSRSDLDPRRWLVKEKLLDANSAYGHICRRYAIWGRPNAGSSCASLRVRQPYQTVARRRPNGDSPNEKEQVMNEVADERLMTMADDIAMAGPKDGSQ
jgi:hypothetical protein